MEKVDFLVLMFEGTLELMTLWKNDILVLHFTKLLQFPPNAFLSNSTFHCLVQFKLLTPYLQDVWNTISWSDLVSRCIIHIHSNTLLLIFAYNKTLALVVVCLVVVQSPLLPGWLSEFPAYQLFLTIISRFFKQLDVLYWISYLTLSYKIIVS